MMRKVGAHLLEKWQVQPRSFDLLVEDRQDLHERYLRIGASITRWGRTCLESSKYSPEISINARLGLFLRLFRGVAQLA